MQKSTIRRFVAFVVVALVLVSQALADRSPHVSLKIEVEQKGMNERTWKTEYGSYRDEWSFQRTLKIGALAIGTGATEAVLRWYFIGTQTATGRPVLISFGEKKVTLGRGGYKMYRVSSEVIEGSDTRYVALNQTDKRGLRPTGWVVRIFSPSEVLLAEQGSTPERIDWLRENLGQLNGEVR